MLASLRFDVGLNLFTDASKTKASFIERHSSTYTNVTGVRDRQYFAPVPSLCALVRDVGSVVQPV